MEYRCTICDKKYKTYQTLWKHNKYFHNYEKPTLLNNVHANNTIV
jgi:hypothetical protein